MLKFKVSLLFSIISFTCIHLFGQSDWGEVKWDKGLKFEDSQMDYQIKMGGRIMLDGLSVWPEKNGVIDTIINAGSGVEFRRIRFYSAGKIYGNILYKLQFDFAGGQAALKDAYITITKIPVIGNLQFGHFKEPIGLELLASSKYITFMERGLTNALTPERNTGIMTYSSISNQRLSWALGYLLPADNFGKYVGNKFNITGRFSGLPVYKNDDQYRVLHLGTSITHQYQNNSKYTLSSRPESHLISTITLAEVDFARAVNQIGFEAAWIAGPFSLQGEYITSNVLTSEKSSLQKDRYNFSAFYAYASWFLTGEHRTYKTSITTFDRVKPKNNFGKDGGIGAWELAIRYSEIDLDDTDISGGNLANISAGLNWYLNPSTRMMFNYIFANLKNSGDFNIYQLRIQIDF